MADTKVYTIPLRREFQKVAYKKRANKAVKALKEFVLKHTKADRVVLGEELNEKMWAQGITNPPHKVQVEITKETVKKDNTDVLEAFVNLVGHKRTVIEQTKKGVIQKDAPAGLQGKLKEAVDTLKGDGKDKVVETESKPVKEDAESDDKPKAEPKAEAKADEKPKAAPKTESKPKTAAKAETTDEKKE